MREIHSTLMLAALAVASLQAQTPRTDIQLPNVGFEQEWVVSRPWSSITDTLSLINATAPMISTYPDGIFGKQPSGWVISNVNGVVAEREDGTFGALGATQVGDSVAGYDSKSALRIYNNHNPFMATQIVPGYVTLGTSWATNTLDFTTFSPANKDGGSFGGVYSNAMPDELTFRYKGLEINPGTVLFYAWTGTWKQADVPANNSMSDETVAVTMIDRERNILGIGTAQGGEVTSEADPFTGEPKLIAAAIDSAVAASADWKAYTLPIAMQEKLLPGKLFKYNVVIASNNYFDSNNIAEGNDMIIDDVKFIFHSRLASLSVNGEPVAGFDAGKYEYSVDAELLNAKIEAAADGNSAVVSYDIDSANAIVKVIVTGAGEDNDGLNTHTYTLRFKAGAVADPVLYPGWITIDMGTGDITEGGQQATVQIIRTSANTCDLLLPDFELTGLGKIGDISVKNVMTEEAADGSVRYEGFVSDMQLLDGNIIADVMLEGTISAAGKANFRISVLWKMDADTTMPILVRFTTDRIDAAVGNIAAESADSPVEFYDLRGIRQNADNLPAGIYIRRQGATVTKVIVR